jgi:SSS family solute:Na+ symporter
MSAHGYWIVGLAVAYTALLIGIGRIATRRAQGEGGYFVAGRGFSPLLVAVCITGLFSGSAFIAILELSYLKGVSALWYGVAETVQILLIAFILLRPFRERALVTISGLIGDSYGRVARGVAGAITAFAFPMWSVATALAFASAVHVSTGVPMLWSLALTALLLLAYLMGGGMWSIGFTQSANAVVFAIMLAIGVGVILTGPGLDGLAALAETRPELLAPDTVGTAVILAWFGTFIVNVPLAQAAFQMSLSCRTAAEGRRGLLLAALFGLPFFLIAAGLGLAAAIALPGGARGLIAVPQYLQSVLPAPLVGLFFLGIWACALGWGAPCQFSGATSLGRDVTLALKPQAKEAELVRYTRLSLILLTFLMVGFGVLRSEQSAWWNILAWTTRNSATFAPVIAALLWPGATIPGVLASLVAGTAAGLGWYELSGWALSGFHYDVHPVWVGMGVNLATLVLVSLATRREGWGLRALGSSTSLVGVAALTAGAGLSIAGAAFFDALRPGGLLGLVLFLGVFGLSLAAMLLLQPQAASMAPAGARPSAAPARTGG